MSGSSGAREVIFPVAGWNGMWGFRALIVSVPGRRGNPKQVCASRGCPSFLAGCFRASPKQRLNGFARKDDNCEYPKNCSERNEEAFDAGQNECEPVTSVF